MTRPTFALLLALFAFEPAMANEVTTVDFLKSVGVDVNAAGPCLLVMDESRNRLVAANTLTSSLSVIDGSNHSVVNIPLGGRAFQHLKSEAMTFRPVSFFAS